MADKKKEKPPRRSSKTFEERELALTKTFEERELALTRRFHKTLEGLASRLHFIDHGDKPAAIYAQHIEFEASDGLWWINTAWRMINGRAEPVALLVGAPKGQAVTAERVRKLPLGSLIDDCRSTAFKRLEVAATIVAEGANPDRAGKWKDAASSFKRPRRLTHDDLTQVAEVYRLAWRSKESPKAAVARAFNLSINGAAKRIAAARAAGLLGKALPGKAGEAQ